MILISKGTDKGHFENFFKKCFGNEIFFIFEIIKNKRTPKSNYKWHQTLKPEMLSTSVILKN